MQSIGAAIDYNYVTGPGHANCVMQHCRVGTSDPDRYRRSNDTNTRDYRPDRAVDKAMMQNMADSGRFHRLHSLETG